MQVPSYVPSSLQGQWQSTYNQALSFGPEYAKVFANNWLSHNVTVTQPREDLVLLSFTIEDSQLIKQTDDGEEYISAVLADLGVTSTGHKFSEAVLLKFTEQINRELPIGDVDHEEMSRLEAQGYSDEQVADVLKSRQKNGIVRAVKAIYDKGKLWVKLLIDKRYKKIVERAKGLSLEAIAKVQSDTKEVTDADLLGFTVAYHQTPANPRALISAAA
jgi:hypothetical protein